MIRKEYTLLLLVPFLLLACASIPDHGEKALYSDEIALSFNSDSSFQLAVDSIKSWRDGNVVYAIEKNSGIDLSECISITIPENYPNDARVDLSLQLQPQTWYNCHGRLRGKEIIPSDGNIGANLCLYPSWEHTASENSTATFEWTKKSFTFQTDSTGKATISCRLGYWNSPVSGKAWFDNIEITSKDFTDPIIGDNLYLLLEQKDVQSIGKKKVEEWLRHLDKAYVTYHELVGTVPYNGEKIGIVSFRQNIGGFAVAGNPIRWKREYIKPELQHIADEGDWSFGILHEISHCFDTGMEKGKPGDRPWNFHSEFFANLKMYFVVSELNAAIIINGRKYKGAELKEYYTQTAESERKRNEYTHDSLLDRFLFMSEQIGWGPFLRTFREFQKHDIDYTAANQSSFSRFSRFIDSLTFFSGDNIWSFFSEKELTKIKTILR